MKQFHSDPRRQHNTNAVAQMVREDTANVAHLRSILTERPRPGPQPADNKPNIVALASVQFDDLLNLLNPDVDDTAIRVARKTYIANILEATRSPRMAS